jgi:hypothetical protein
MKRRERLEDTARLFEIPVWVVCGYAGWKEFESDARVFLNYHLTIHEHAMFENHMLTVHWIPRSSSDKISQDLSMAKLRATWVGQEPI